MTNNSQNGNCMGFVLYYPSKKIVKMIQSLSNANKVYIFDNTPLSSHALKVSDLDYRCDNYNRGLGFGLKSICLKAYNDGYKGIIFFDQDTYFTDETIKYIEYFVDRNNSFLKKYSSITFNNKNKIPCSKDTLLSINSGTFFFLQKLKNIGWHNSSFFVDCVDYEYCFRARKNGFLLLEHSCTPGFDHFVSQDADLIPFFGKKYSLLRSYSKIRVKGTLKNATKLLLLAIKDKDIHFSLSIFKFIVIYISSQTAATFISKIRT